MKRFFLIIFYFIAADCRSQCAFNLGNDTCISPPISLNLVAPPNSQSYLWNTGSKDNNIPITQPGIYFCTITQLGTDLIKNGDFSSGITGFSSSYTSGASGTYGPLTKEGTYGVNADPSKLHYSFPAFGDHTSGSGNMMVVNGNSIANASIWCQSIPVTPNTNYNFSTWVAICFATKAEEVPKLQFSINGQPLGSVFSPPFTIGQWTQFNSIWNSGSNTTANICIVNKNTVAAGNDFALDDIFFQTVCSASDTIEISSSVQVKANAGTDQTICAGDTIKLNGQVTNTTRGIWSGGDGIFIPSNTALNARYVPGPTDLNSGNTTLKLIANNTSIGCSSTDSDEIIITITAAGKANAGPDQIICEGNTVQLNGSLSGGNTNATWSGGQGVFSPNNQQVNAIYSPHTQEINNGKALLILKSNASGSCKSLPDTLFIQIDKLAKVNAGVSQSVCAEDSIQLNATIGGSTVTAIWSGGNGIFSKSNSDLKAVYKPTAAEIAAGKVTLRLTSVLAGACPTTSSEVTHIIKAKPLVNFSVDIPKDCPSHCVRFNDSTKTPGSGIKSWLWEFEMKNGNAPLKSATGKDPQNICFETPGIYNVKLNVVSEQNCAAFLLKEEMIETYKQPKADFKYTPEAAEEFEPVIHLSDQSSADVTSWQWDFGDGSKPIENLQKLSHTYDSQTGAYVIQLSVINANGCKDTIKHMIEIKPSFSFFIPNAFTPDDDQLNDVFFGKGRGIAKYHLLIVDRWGNIVFETTDINQGWDGKVNRTSEVSMQDVYVWKVKITDVFGKNHQYMGTVTLVK
ncbi:MAG TPA: PKD domain-containing protein [Bacteroidia bacterium]|nr:PKD domain-containing protein [Bacteroidia bacterium]